MSQGEDDSGTPGESGFKDYSRQAALRRWECCMSEGRMEFLRAALLGNTKASLSFPSG
jgi:hypothetical protein